MSPEPSFFRIGPAAVSSSARRSSASFEFCELGQIVETVFPADGLRNAIPRRSVVLVQDELVLSLRLSCRVQEPAEVHLGNVVLALFCLPSDRLIRLWTTAHRVRPPMLSIGMSKRVELFVEQAVP